MVFVVNIILFPADTHASKFMCAIYCTGEVIVFSLLFCYYYIFLVRKKFSLKDFSINIIYMKFKT